MDPPPGEGRSHRSRYLKGRRGAPWEKNGAISFLNSIGVATDSRTTIAFAGVEACMYLLAHGAIPALPLRTVVLALSHVVSRG